MASIPRERDGPVEIHAGNMTTMPLTTTSCTSIPADASNSACRAV